MKKAIAAGILLAAGLVSAYAQQREVYDMLGWDLYMKGNSSIRVRDAGNGGVTFYGKASREGGAGYVIENTNLGLDGKRRIILVVSGINDTDEFNRGKLLKLELNGRPVRTQNNRDTNRGDPDFLNARNGEYVFDLANLGAILKINIVFYDCTVGALTLRMFVE